MDNYEKVESLVESVDTDNYAIMMNEAFDSETYALEQKIVKSKSDISYIFADEVGDRYRLQFLASPKLGKGVVKVYVGKAKSAKLFVDKIDRFANPKAMIATVINFFTEHLLTPEGMQLRGFVIDMSGAASVRAIPLMKKVIKSTLVSKVKPWLGADFNPVDNRKYLWVYKSTLKPQEVFDGVGVPTDAPWFTKDTKADAGTEKRTGVDNAGLKSGEADVVKKFENDVAKPYVASLEKKYPNHSFSYKVEMSWDAPKHLPISLSITVDGVRADNNFFDSADTRLSTLNDMLGRGIDLKIKEIDKKRKELEKSKAVSNIAAFSASIRDALGKIDSLTGLLVKPSEDGSTVEIVAQYNNVELPTFKADLSEETKYAVYSFFQKEIKKLLDKSVATVSPENGGSKQTSNGKLANGKSKAAKQLVDAGFTSVIEIDDSTISALDSKKLKVTFKTENSNEKVVSFTHSLFPTITTYASFQAQLKALYSGLCIGGSLHGLENKKSWWIPSGFDNAYELKDVSLERIDKTKYIFKLDIAKGKNKDFVYPEDQSAITASRSAFIGVESKTLTIQLDKENKLKFDQMFFTSSEEFNGLIKDTVYNFLTQYTRSSGAIHKSQLQKQPEKVEDLSIPIKASFMAANNIYRLTYIRKTSEGIPFIGLKSNASNADLSLSNVMFNQNEFRGTAAEKKALRDAILNGNPKTSKELVKILNKITYLNWISI